MKRTKTQNCKKHFRRRFRERFGIDVHKDLYEKIIKQIRTGKAELVERKSNRVKLYKVVIDETEYQVIYDKLRKTLVTVFPRKIE